MNVPYTRSDQTRNTNDVHSTHTLSLFNYNNMNYVPELCLARWHSLCILFHIILFTFIFRVWCVVYTFTGAVVLNFNFDLLCFCWFASSIGLCQIAEFVYAAYVLFLLVFVFLYRNIVNFSSSFAQSRVLLNWNLLRVRKTRWQLNNDRWRWLQKWQMKGASKIKTEKIQWNTRQFEPVYCTSFVFYTVKHHPFAGLRLRRRIAYWASFIHKSLWTFVHD